MVTMFKILARFWRLLVPCVKAPGGKAGLALFAVAVALNLGAVYASLRLTRWTGEFYSAVEKVDAAQVYYQIGIFALIVGLNSARGLAHEYIRKVIEIRWRRSLTDHAINLWTTNKAYWFLANDGDSRIDNPDQRIAEDCRLFTKGLLGEALDLIGEVVGLVSYVALLWSLANFPLSLAFVGLDYEIPRYMVWSAFIYVAICSVITHVLGYPLKGLLTEQQKREASFRFAMARWRGSFDEVALAGGEAVEKEGFKRRFDAVANNWGHLIRRELILGLFTYPFRHSVLRIPLFVALPGYLAGHVAFGGLMQLSMAFSNVVTTLSWFIFSYRNLADLVATAARLDNFLLAAEAAGKQRVSTISTTDNGDALAPRVKDLRLYTPDKHELASLGEMPLAAGGAVWLQGRSGIGKTTLVKALAGLWHHRDGQVIWPTSQSMFLSQKPYLPTGTLLEAAIYPALADEVDEKRAIAVLHEVGLGHRPDTLLVGQDDAPDGLSGGEVQRLALARLLIHKPKWAILDEATSALDEKAERALLSLLREKLPNTAFLIVSHRKPEGIGAFSTIGLSEPIILPSTMATA
jgi:putative ATP-binding cassette transporter